jgi:isopentenyl-diphosphate delta-isomerase
MTNLEDARAEIVSFDTEPLILVNEADEPVGALSKVDCHKHGGILHRAFSLFVFNEQGELLVHQRAASKPLWPGYWSNSCCSHPRVGESMDHAIARRSQEELGFATAMSFVYKFEYTAHFSDLGTEHELCSVYTGEYHGEPDINVEEISDYRWMSAAEVDAFIADETQPTTPWFAMEWQQLKSRGIV